MSRDVEMGYRAVRPAEGGSNVKNTLHFNVSYYVTRNEKKSSILDSVSDIVESGEMLAIMGKNSNYYYPLLLVHRV